MENTAENGSLVSKEKLNNTSVEGESTENIVDASSERHQPSDEDSTFENPSHFWSSFFFFFYKLPHSIATLDPDVSSTPSLTENGQTLNDIEKSTPDDGDASEHTDKHTSPQLLVSDDQPCGEERGGEDGANNLEQTNKDV